MPCSLLLFYCVLLIHGMLHFYCLSCKDCSQVQWCEWLQEGRAAQVFARAQVCREGSGSRVLPCSARPAPSAPRLCFMLYWADRLIRSPSILVSLPCSPGSQGHPCVIFLCLVDLWGFLKFSCTGSTGVTVLNVCAVSDWGRSFSSHLLLRSKRKAAFIK